LALITRNIDRQPNKEFQQVPFATCWNPWLVGLKKSQDLGSIGIYVVHLDYQLLL